MPKKPITALNAPPGGPSVRSGAALAKACRAKTRRFAVRFLTGTRRKPGAWARRLPVALLLGLPAASFAAADWQPVDTLGRQAEDFLAGHLGADDERTTLRANPLDPRLQLPRCSETPEAFLQRGTKVSSRMTVGLRCNGTRPWKIYVTVDVIVSESVLVAARTLPAGHVLTADDLTADRRDVARLTAGYVQQPAEVLGRRLKHGVIEGQVLKPGSLKADVVVHRGQSVTLTVHSDSLNIRMEGKALMDGRVNERIRVQNSLSRRVVEGIVRSPEHVEVLVF